MNSRAGRIVIGAAALLFFCGFLALGTWQVERRGWKLALIARVEARVHLPATPAPGVTEWPLLGAASHEYRHVWASGTLLNSAETLVQATTELGAGFWVLTPLRRQDGTSILINRGFVAARREPGSDSAITRIEGLLRLPEPRGGFLRLNDPSANRWYSRDVTAIAAARHILSVAPYFIDADAATDAGDPRGASNAPVGGLTVIDFYNNHLAYAIIWYTLAAMIPAALWLGIRDIRRQV